MRLTTIAYLHRARLRARLVQEALAVVGIAVGVALLFASQIANTSLSGSMTRLTNGLVGSSRLQITARDSRGFDERLLGEVRRLRGVRIAAPVLDRSVNLIGRSGSRSIDLIGVDSSFIGLKGRVVQDVSAVSLSKQRGLALPVPIADEIGVGPLQPMRVGVGERSARTFLASALRERDIGELIHSPVAIAPLALAQRLTSSPGRITRILVEPRAGRDHEVQLGLQRISAGRLDVRPANFDATVFSQAEGPTTQSTELFSVISALVGFLFAFNAMLLTAPQRRKLIRDLRLDGYAPLEIVQVMLFDAVALGLAGSLLGLALGDLLSRGLMQTSPGYLSFAFPVGSLQIVSWQSIALASAGGLLAAIVGVLLPLRADVFAHKAIFVKTHRESERVTAVRPLLAGFACIALTTALLLTGIANVRMAIIAFVSLVIALLTILPIWLRAIVAAFNRLQRPLTGVATHIAAIELRSSATRARSLAIVATGAIAVFGSVAVQGARQNLQHGLDGVSREVTRVADLWVSPAGASDTLATQPFESRIGAKLARLPGIARVSVYRGAFLDVGERRALVLAPPRVAPEPVPPGQLLQGEPALASARLRAGGWIVLSQALADAYHVRVGGLFRLTAPRPMTLRLAATTTNFGWPPGAIILNAQDFARAWGSTDPSAYELTLMPGASSAAVRGELESALGARSPLIVQSAGQREQAFRATQRQGLSRLNEIAALVLIAAALAMATAMGALIWQRRPRLSGMKVDGFDQSELWRALVCESALLLGAGCSIGAAFGLYGQLLLSQALVTVTGFPVAFAIAAPIAAAIFATVTLTAVAIVALPGYAAARVKPALGD